MRLEFTVCACAYLNGISCHYDVYPRNVDSYPGFSEAGKSGNEARQRQFYRAVPTLWSVVNCPLQVAQTWPAIIKRGGSWLLTSFGNQSASHRSATRARFKCLMIVLVTSHAQCSPSSTTDACTFSTRAKASVTETIQVAFTWWKCLFNASSAK